MRHSDVRRRSVASVLVTAALLATLPAGTAAAQTADVNCRDFRYQEDAQAVFDAHPGDPFHLDANQDGVACESLPHRPTSTSASATPTSTTSAAAPSTTTSSAATSSAASTTTAAPATTVAPPTTTAAATTARADRDCADFPTQAAAQAALDAEPGDPERLDANHNGIACEDNFGTAGRQVTVVPSGAPATGGTGAW
jgi:Excalibur calcium-binding domain